MDREALTRYLLIAVLGMLLGGSGANVLGVDATPAAPEPCIAEPWKSEVDRRLQSLHVAIEGLTAELRGRGVIGGSP